MTSTPGSGWSDPGIRLKGKVIAVDRRTGGRARKTGNATSAAGGYANTGIHHGDVHLTAPPVARSAYGRQVARIAPPELLAETPNWRN